MPYDALKETKGGKRADREYPSILHPAATESEEGVDNAPRGRNSKAGYTR